jgi:hypothetical protein
MKEGWKVDVFGDCHRKNEHILRRKSQLKIMEQVRPGADAFSLKIGAYMI